MLRNDLFAHVEMMEVGNASELTLGGGYSGSEGNGNMLYTFFIGF